MMRYLKVRCFSFFFSFNKMNSVSPKHYWKCYGLCLMSCICPSRFPCSCWLCVQWGWPAYASTGEHLVLWFLAEFGQERESLGGRREHSGYLSPSAPPLHHAGRMLVCTVRATASVKQPSPCDSLQVWSLLPTSLFQL